MPLSLSLGSIHQGNNATPLQKNKNIASCIKQYSVCTFCAEPSSGNLNGALVNRHRHQGPPFCSALIPPSSYLDPCCSVACC